MRFGVDTGPMRELAARLEADAGAASAALPSLQQSLDDVRYWASSGRTRDAGHAVLETLHWAAEGVEEGLRLLADRVTAAADNYDGVDVWRYRYW